MYQKNYKRIHFFDLESIHLNIHFFRFVLKKKKKRINLRTHDAFQLKLIPILRSIHRSPFDTLRCLITRGRDGGTKHRFVIGLVIGNYCRMIIGC